MEIGPLIQDKTQEIGVENTPIFVDGRTSVLPFEWKKALTTVSFLVIPTLVEPDVILGMDLLQRLGVKIDTKLEWQNLLYWFPIFNLWKCGGFLLENWWCSK